MNISHTIPVSEGPSRRSVRRIVLTATGLLLAWSAVARAQSDPYSGLWVGQATLTRVNEVSIPLDENNDAIAPDPDVATPTKDAAHLRMILHVNGAGQANLLKDVAILARGSGTDGALRSESDLSLVTDERLYPEFAPQPARRIASAVFDFGDSRATDALNEVMETAAAAAADSVMGLAAGYPLDSQTERLAAIDAAEQAALDAATPIVHTADVARVFSTFLSDELDLGTVDAIAADTNAATPAFAAGEVVRDGSFYADSRGVDVVSNVIAAVIAAGPELEDRERAAQNMASSFADVTDNYQRFIASKQVGDMIASAAAAAAVAATNPAASEASIRLAVNGDSAVGDAKADAQALGISGYRDTRASDAVATILDAIIASAVDALTNTPVLVDIVEVDASARGRTALEADVMRYPLAPQTPTLDYDEFVLSDGFLASAETAAAAAATAAVTERRESSLYTADSVRNAARIAAFDALRSVYGSAAQAVRNELPLAGVFGPGEGDPRMTWEIAQGTNVPALGPGALTATLYLPASHPTNPFRHRRHPDHTIGFDVQRHIRFDFDSTPSNTLERVGYGVERITGIYREEIMGLHKPLGTNAATGLKIEGTFELQRISLIDALNSQ